MEPTTEQTPQQPVTGQAQTSPTGQVEAPQPGQEGQVQQTGEQQAGQASEGVHPDLGQIPLDQLTSEQVKELQQGYLRQSDYTKKMQAIAVEKKIDYEELIQRPDFIEWAQSKVPQHQSQQQSTQEPDISDMSEEERIAHYVKKNMAPIAQSYYQDKQATEDKELSVKYQDAPYKEYVPKITQLQQAIVKQPYIYREEAFKILDYELAKQRAFEAGRQEGLKGKQIRTNANIVQEQTVPPSNQREIIRGPGALNKIWERAENEGRPV